MNEANQANFSELQGHIRITKAKMAKAGEAEESLADDLEAYYERQLQLEWGEEANVPKNLPASDQQQPKVAAKKKWWGELHMLLGASCVHQDDR